MSCGVLSASNFVPASYGCVPPEEVLVTAKYSFSGLTCDDYNSNKVAFDGAFKAVIAQEVSGITVSDVNIDEVSVNGDAGAYVRDVTFAC